MLECWNFILFKIIQEKEGGQKEALGRGKGCRAIIILELGSMLVLLEFVLQDIIHDKGACLNT